MADTIQELPKHCGPAGAAGAMSNVMREYPRDCTNRLGIQKMPPGYRLWMLDSGHYMWELDDRIEGAIHWSRWAVYRGAWHHYRSTEAV